MKIVDAQVHIWGANTPQRPWPARAEPHRTPLGKQELLAEMDKAVAIARLETCFRQRSQSAKCETYCARAAGGNIPSANALISSASRWFDSVARPGSLANRRIRRSICLSLGVTALNRSETTLS